MSINADATVQILAEEAHPLERFDPQVHCLVVYLVSSVVHHGSFFVWPVIQLLYRFCM